MYCVVPALPADPRAALAQIAALLADGREHLLVGSSLGGYYAIHFVETTNNARAVLVNPALAVADKLAPLVGEEQQNYHSGETYIFTEAYRAALAEIEIAPSKWANYLALLQTGDEVLDCREAATAFAPSNPVIEEAAITVSRLSPIICRASRNSPGARARFPTASAAKRKATPPPRNTAKPNLRARRNLRSER